MGNLVLAENILCFSLNSLNIKLCLLKQPLQMPSLLVCISGSLLNLPSFLERLSVWHLLQRSEGPNVPCIKKLMSN